MDSWQQEGNQYCYICVLILLYMRPPAIYAAAVPGFQAAEEWIRGNEFGWSNYLKVQRWWHQCILFCTPKWEAFEKWAKDAKVPYFARRVLSNAVFHRISYLCCSRMLTDADGC